MALIRFIIAAVLVCMALGILYGLVWSVLVWGFDMPPNGDTALWAAVWSGIAMALFPEDEPTHHDPEEY